MNTNEPMLKNAILVYEDQGQVKHRFCTEAQGKLDHAAMAGGSLHTFEDIDAEILFSVSSTVQGRVMLSKEKLKSDIAIRDTLDKHGVPTDHGIRATVYRAVRDLRAQWVPSL